MIQARQTAVGKKNCKSVELFYMELTVGITGASGTIYAFRTLQLLAASGAVTCINLVMSGTSATVAQVEMGVNLKDASTEKINEWLGLAKDSKIIRSS